MTLVVTMAKIVFLLFWGVFATVGAQNMVSPYARKLKNQAPTDEAECNGVIGSDGTSYYEATVVNGIRYLVMSGIPSHDAEYDQIKANPNTRCKLIF
jgi:6-phosphogluconate dehydrogenase